MEINVDNGTKVLISAVLILIVSYFGVQFILSWRNNVPSVLLNSPKINQSEFLTEFSDTNSVAIIMDVRNSEDNETKRAILQCGVDFAGSFGFADKNVKYYSFDYDNSKEECISSDMANSSMGISVSKCLNEINEYPMIIYIKNGNSTQFYKKGVVVGVNKQYILGTCAINPLKK